MYHGKPLLSASQAKQELAIQHATYNLFGDPALQIAYAEQGIEISTPWPWHLARGSLSVSGRGNLPAGQRVSVSVQALQGVLAPTQSAVIGTAERYRQANNLILASENANVGPDGKFSGTLAIPPGTPAGKYTLRAISSQGGNTYVTARPLYIGWPPFTEVVSSSSFWCIAISAALLFRMIGVSMLLRNEDSRNRTSILEDHAGRSVEARLANT